MLTLACPAAAAAAADHLKVVEDQAMAMIRQNERLEKRMMALEQHVQVRRRGVRFYVQQRWNLLACEHDQ
jgi:hypothetical protein